MVASLDLDCLRTAQSASGFRNVYVAAKSEYGSIVYVAKVKLGGRLLAVPGSRHPQPHVCAGFVLDWYREKFGANWKAVLKGRKRNPYRTWHSEKWGGWCAAVWLWGERVEVRQLRRGDWRRLQQGGKAARRVLARPPAVFPGPAEARRAARAFARGVWGVFAPAALWRG